MKSLQINGDRVNVPQAVVTVVDLLEHLQLEHKVLIVEYNKQILEKSSHAQTRLENGDSIEIVHFVGGG